MLTCWPIGLVFAVYFSKFVEVMMEFLNNIAELGKATWTLFRMCPSLCIIVAVAAVLAIVFAYSLCKEILHSKWRDPIILR